jgi:hypothetical protein
MRKITLLSLLAVALVSFPALAQSRTKARIHADSERIASLLHDVAAKDITVGEAGWKTIANEANTLANRIYGYTAGNKAARALAGDLRMHVREMRKAARARNAAEARMHAREALPFATKLIDWSAS